jgi:hypothetical protein
MPVLRFVVEGRPGTVQADAFLAAAKDFLDVLRDVDRVVSGERKGTLKWVIQGLHTSSLVADFACVRRDDAAEDFSVNVPDSAYRGLVLLEGEARVPDNFSATGLGHVARLAGRQGRCGVTALKVVRLDDKQETPVTPKAGENAKAALAPSTKGIGSVMGRLEMVSLHRRPFFNVYDACTRRAVRCDFDRAKELDEVKAALGRRVLAAGLLHRNKVGQAVRVTLKSLQIIPFENELPTVDDLVGISPDFTGDMTTDEYLRKLRDG